MKKFHTGKRILTLFMPGFLFGIIYTNFIARQYVAEPEVFSDYFTAVFTDQDRCTGIYLVCFKGKSDSVCSSSWAGIYENEKNDCIAFCNLDWHIRRNPSLNSRDGTGNQRKYLLPAGDFSSVPLLYSFFSDCSFLLLDVSEKQMEQRKNHYVCRYAFKWDDHGNLCKSVFAACFSEKILVVFFKNGFAVVRRRQKRKIILTTNWLIRSPQRYPCMPDSGITI